MDWTIFWTAFGSIATAVGVLVTVVMLLASRKGRKMVLQGHFYGPADDTWDIDAELNLKGETQVSGHFRWCLVEHHA